MERVGVVRQALCACRSEGPDGSRFIGRRARPAGPGLGRPAVVVIAVTALAWTVVRNLPGFPLEPTILSQ